MAQIKIVRDHNLKMSPIIVPLGSPRLTEKSDKDIEMITPTSQTASYGVIAPIIKVNDIVVNIADIVYFELDNESHIPSLYFIIRDPNDLIKGLQQPSSDSEVRIQILPKFENAYKKIDMVFYINSCEYNGDEISFSCTYKVLDLYKNHIKCFGELSTYELFDKLSAECQLGFASNIESSSDKRYLYCASDNYIEFMNNVIRSSGDENLGIQSLVVYDYWIDYWNNLNLVDIYERFLSLDSKDDMMIWISPTIREDQDNSHFSNDEDQYIRVPAIISNHPTTTDTDLGIGSYQVINSSSMLTKGSDRIFATYNMLDGESLDYLLSDGDQKKDLSLKYQYLGECYRDYNYLLAAECRDMKKDKMTGEVIEVVLSSPSLALSKGSKVEIQWYDTNNELQTIKERSGLDESISTNIPIPQADKKERYDSGPTFVLNEQVSGQYYILSNNIVYQDSTWQHTLRLTRPREHKSQYLEGLTENAKKQL